MSDAKRDLGVYGESQAARLLRSKGYTIIKTNWTCEHGEIDIVAQEDETLVFVEVRTRHAGTTERAFESIDERKQAKLATLAYAYLDAHALEDVAWRIDVVAIAVPRGGRPVIEHVEDALGW